MYLPPQFKGDLLRHALPLIRQNPFASLVSVDDAGLPFITHLPLHLEAQSAPAKATLATATPVMAEPSLQLLGHVARQNPHWRYLQQRPTAVVSFLGPHAYMSPSVYPDLARVPTWNYLAVHCTVQATLVESEEGKDALLKKLIADHEPAYAQQWCGLDSAYVQKMLAGIVGFELEVIDLQCKIKLNQHRPEARGAMQASYAAGNEDERKLAEWLDRLNP